MPSLLERVLRTGDRKTLKRLHVYADAIERLEEPFQTFTDAELREETDKLKARHADGELLDELLPEAFAAVREASSRTLGMRHFRVQLMGGAALHLGNIAEMKTGEGKTLVATAPAYLNALGGNGVHVVTVNDYLAEYQSDLMGRVYRFLGLTSGCILSNQDPAVRRQQYEADITYGTNNEFGFDYLRDNMAWSAEELVQRGHHYAVVDEVDSILIDEARTPLIISGPASGDANRWYGEFAKMVLRLNNEDDYEVDEKKRTVGVLEPGIEKVEDYLGVSNLYESANTPLIGFLNNAIKAKELFKRDKDYVILDGEVLIVDEHTGRILAGRRYNEGMHQAIEAKEGVEIKAENQTLATVTLQNYFRLYKKLSGMTGTAETEAAEFMGTYSLGVVPIPTNKPMRRIDQSDLVYKNEVVKFDAVVEDIAKRHDTGQPVLVGTTSVEKSEYLSKQLAKRGIKHEVLNAKNHAREAAIVAQAGRRGAVTVATNMAGRGTDIMLGGNAEFNAVAALAARGLDPEETPEEYEAAWTEAFEDAKNAVSEEHDAVVEAGGLYVLGTERHESRRIDNQLRGRSGRQGDPGESRFYLSLTDDLMRLFNSGAAERLMSRSVMPDDVALESKLVSKAIASAQGQVEGRNAEQRKNVLKYDDVLNRQREAIYGDRRRILQGDDLHEKVQFFLEDTVSESIDAATAEGHSTDWDLKALLGGLKTLYPVSVSTEELEEEAGGEDRITPELLKTELLSDAKLAYQDREEKLGSETMRELERRVVLSVVGRKWQEHLYEMDYLKEGIGLRAMAQRDPLVEYQREGFTMFQAMMGAIREESIGLLFNLEVQVEEPAAAQVGVVADQPASLLQRVAGAASDGAAPVGVQDGHSVAATEEHAAMKFNAPGLQAPEQPASLQFTAPDVSGEAETHTERSSRGTGLPPAAKNTGGVKSGAAKSGAAKTKKKKRR
ncbi:preprotein translocase subunit SecA [Arthrobacter sp. H14-L1]|uniref:preprotein translocase subunit SecA n=1 Tax=Arthrobacter sp. H14-L1 TaxID=2996697 RepID=UPI00226DA4C3|nr:preprotein translocase subunit SecA [Arthrobacter sp. H14-L1]MCY0903553.1 preprotein translocase subunit SecA [Arthrobacter sp. H14-L1]